MKINLFALMIACLVASCGSADVNENEIAISDTSSKEEMYIAKKEQLQELEAAVNADTDYSERKLRQQLVATYATFTNQYNQDDMAAEYLFRAGKLANEIGKPRRAIDFLMNAHDGYPLFNKRTEAAFLVGFIYENVLNDRIMAQTAYEKVIELYPESSWADDAQASIQLLYLTDSEKIKRFKEQNQN